MMRCVSPVLRLTYQEIRSGNVLHLHEKMRKIFNIKTMFSQVINFNSNYLDYLLNSVKSPSSVIRIVLDSAKPSLQTVSLRIIIQFYNL